MNTNIIDFKQDCFNIINVAKKLGISIIKPTNSSKKVIALCPFCNDTSGHLYLTLENGTYFNVYKCVKCGKSGSSVNLYGTLKNLSHKDAITELLNDIPNYNIIKFSKEIIKQHNNKQCFEPKEFAYLNKIYNTFIDLLPLYKKHYQNLINRGLFPSTIRNQGYRSIPKDYKLRQNICDKIIELHGSNCLEGVPGFYFNKYSKWDFYAPSGFLIPIRNISNLIIGFQIRFDNIDGTGKKKPRYKNFSSNGFFKGTKIIPHVSFSYNSTFSCKKVVITEGPLKASISTQFTDITFLALPGVSAQHNELISILKELNPMEVSIAFDMDILKTKEVLIALNHLIDLLKQNNFKYKLIRWDYLYLKDNKLKGIDDYLFFRYNQLKSKIN